MKRPEPGKLGQMLTITAHYDGQITENCVRTSTPNECTITINK